ncbi:MAG: hypothetical protein ACYTGH_15580 [Planctomycetota bacterium]|jgi:hypothetical protein
MNVHNLASAVALACLLLFLLCGAGCRGKYEGFGRHSLNRLKEQVGDYKSSKPTDLTPLKRSVKRYISEEKRNAPKLTEQVDDYRGTHREDWEELKFQTRRYLATQ